MSKIYGKIESLKKLKNELCIHGIDRFNSIKEIHDFLYNFQIEKEKIIDNQRQELEYQIRNLRDKIKEGQEKYEVRKIEILAEIDSKVESTKEKIERLTERSERSLVHKFILSFILKKQLKVLSYYCNYPSLIINNETKGIQGMIVNDTNDLNYLTQNSELIIKERSTPAIQNIEYIKKTVVNLQPLIAGAVGEQLVVKEIEKLSDDYILINDYNLTFRPPIFNKNTNDRISSIQIDHLLISKSGIYILETKNWSLKSIQSLDLRSPVEQVKRTSYALFVILNTASIALNQHHWGNKKIPIKSIVVMINEKPTVDFIHVKVKSLKELNNYLNFFEPVFCQTEVERIANYLMGLQN